MLPWQFGQRFDKGTAVLGRYCEDVGEIGHALCFLRQFVASPPDPWEDRTTMNLFLIGSRAAGGTANVPGSGLRKEQTNGIRATDLYGRWLGV